MRDMRDVTDLKGLKDLFLKLISASQGEVSSTRLLFLVGGLAAVFCALVATMAGVIDYCVRHEADKVYWGAVVTLWTAKLGFGAYAKTEQQKHSVDRELGQRQHTMAQATASGD